VLWLDDHTRRAQRGTDGLRGNGDLGARGPLEHGRHDRPALDASRGDGVRSRDLDPRDGQVADGALLHGSFAERGKHVGDVVEEDPVRSDDQHAFTGQHAAVLEQQVGGPVQSDGGLPGPRTTLDDEGTFERSTDDVVLLGLDGGHDLPHRSTAGGTDLGQDGVRDAARDIRSVRVVEMLVEVRGEPAVGQREAAAQAQAQRIVDGRPIEGRRHRRTPVDDDGLVALVLDVPAADVPPVPCLLVEPAEEVARTGLSQVGQRVGDDHLDVLLRDLVGRALTRGQRLEAAHHRHPAPVRVGQVSLLGGQVGEER
jgi:hypothetical protein